MPIYKVNAQLSTGGRSSVTDGQTADQLAAYSELPESERYVVPAAVNKQPVEHFGDDKMMSSESATDFIEREIREQREREKELSVLHNLVKSGGGGVVSPRNSYTDAAPAGDQKRRSVDVTDHHVVVTASAAPKSFRETEVVSDEPSLHRHKDEKSDVNNNADNITRADLSDSPRVPDYHGFPGNDEELLDGQQFAHPGESLIVKELLEQQRREDELRQHWKSMGFDLNDDHNADDDDIFNDRKSPDDRKQETKMTVVVTSSAAPLEASHFQTAEHDQPHRQLDKTSPGKTEAAAVVEVPRPKLSSTEPLVSVTTASRPPETVVTSERVSVTSSVTGRTSTSELQAETPKYVKKILLPLESAADMEDADAKVYMQPQAERAMEREIRAARKREIELREARGIPATTHEEARRSASIEIEVMKPTMRADATDGAKLDGRPASGELAPEYRDFTKRFAESRLKVELQRERQRELDLRQSGVIHTISEERVGEPVKFVEVFASDEERAAAKLEASRRFRRSADPDMAPSPQHRPGDAPPPLHASLPPVPATAPVKATSTPEKDQSPFLGYRRELPQVLRTYGYPYTAESRNVVTADTLMSSTRVSPGNRIEQEVEEFQKRENELRELREMLMRERAANETGDDHVTTDHHDNHRHDNQDKHDTQDHHHQQDDLPLPDKQEVSARSSLPVDMTSSSGRRRLAMIADWEKMTSS